MKDEKIDIDLMLREMKKCKDKLYKIACLDYDEDFVKGNLSGYDLDDCMGNTNEPAMTLILDHYYRGDSDMYYITVPTREMNEPIEYFIKKKEDEIRKKEEQKRLEEEKKKAEEEENRKRREDQEYRRYLELKRKYENGEDISI